ncbi:MAG: MgtC/SapB family protein [Lactobacillus sp.]|nr:MgtC/SapB family protein [Lactobacillus sp.]
MVTASTNLVQLEWLFRVILAAICGGLIGYERATQRKSAGVRTHIVVAIASALFMIVSKYGFYDLLKLQSISLDPSRIAAQIVTGISFIGAGTILIRREQVSGLTTAAGVWAVAAIGTSIGAGLYSIGITTTVFLFIIQRIFHDDNFTEKIIRRVRFNIQVEVENRPGILKEIREQLEQNNVENISIKLLDVTDSKIIFNTDGIIYNKTDENEIILNLKKYPNVIRINFTRGGN